MTPPRTSSTSPASLAAQVLVFCVITITLLQPTTARSYEKESYRKGKSAQISAPQPTITTQLVDLCSEDINMKLACHCSPENHAKAQKASCSIFDGELPRKDANWLAFHTQTSLEHLKFTVRKSGNLTYIPSDVIFTLKKLRTLTIEYGIISDIHPYAFGNLSELRVANLPNNQIKTLHPNAFANHPALEEIVLENNDIRRIDREAFVNLPLVIKLNLANNSISELHDNGFVELSKLEELRLELNMISVLAKEYFKGLENLKILKLSYNDVNYVGATVFADLWSLQMLFLDGNKIEKLDERAFDGLNNLRYLHLENNRLVTLESGTFTSVSALLVLNLDGNSLETLSYSHIVPLMDNLVNSSALLSIRDNRFVCDCRLAWVYDLSNRTRNEDLKENLHAIECTLGAKKNYYSTGAQQTQSTLDNAFSENEFDEEGDYIEDAALDNESTIDEKPEIVSLFKLGKEQLPCPEELVGPTDGPNPRESKGLLDLPWGHSGVSAIRPAGSSSTIVCIAAILVSSVGLVMVSSVRW
ncbi:connectin [Topomyia yanbarensis]|uniref:connectin n=1 Tax=Topomyia yanbarensis TaxID=2498891 RepID=UPI00273C6A0F|nr:connectin [Topomyia yanbarensis]XP_058823715.1 connectin [Topomyia yanbarensis]XP_058823716.1 connectin [Topomyia yanbarensis]XP_058823717.1 connectin [Topomyia yanbarensis]XP_058823718.1 connectin [Topomyia yanbarensis]